MVHEGDYQQKSFPENFFRTVTIISFTVTIYFFIYALNT